MKSSIKRRVLGGYLFLIVFAIMLLDILLFITVKNYYYENAEKVLRNQIETATTFYSKYFPATILEQNIYDNVDVFWNQTEAEVQVFNKDGKILMDSIGVNSHIEKDEDIESALNGNITRQTREVEYYDYTVMSVSAPIRVENDIIGVLRYIISLEDVDKEVYAITTSFVGLSIIVLTIGIAVSLIISRSIIHPITELTKVANAMAEGDFQTRIKIKRKDEIGKLNETFNYMADELAKRDKLKDEFISSVSHELRTPLTAIKGWVITLEDENTDGEILKTGLKIIEKESDRLGNMVEELLDFSRLQNGKANINKKIVNIKEFIKYIQQYISQRAKRENKNLHISFDLEKDNVFMDPDKIKQVIINIMDNAFRFTEVGGDIFLDVFCDKRKLVISVKDNGCGIVEEDLPRVKEKFYKGKNKNSQNGIGLSICDEIIKLHNGELNINSKSGVGTEVIFEIPNEGGNNNEKII